MTKLLIPAPASLGRLGRLAGTGLLFASLCFAFRDPGSRLRLTVPFEGQTDIVGLRPDGREVLTASSHDDGHIVVVRELPTGRVTGRWVIPAAMRTTAQLSIDGRFVLFDQERLVTTSPRYSMVHRSWLLERHTGMPAEPLAEPESSFGFGRFAGRGRTLALFRGRPPSLAVWELSPARLTEVRDFQAAFPTPVFSPDGTLVALVDYCANGPQGSRSDAEIVILNTQTPLEVATVTDRTGWSRTAEFSANNRYLATTLDPDGYKEQRAGTRLYSVRTGLPVEQPPLVGEWGPSAVWLAGGTAAGFDGNSFVGNTFVHWDVESGRVLGRHRLRFAPADGGVKSAGRVVIASGSALRTPFGISYESAKWISSHLMRVDYGTSNCLFVVDAHTGQVRLDTTLANYDPPSYRVTPDGTTIACVSMDGRLHIWDLRPQVFPASLPAAGFTIAIVLAIWVTRRFWITRVVPLSAH